MTYQPGGLWEQINRRPVPLEDPLSVFGQTGFEQPDPRRVQPVAELGIDPSILNPTQAGHFQLAQERLDAAREVPGLGLGETVVGLFRGGLKPERQAALQARQANMELYGTIVRDLASDISPKPGELY